MNLLEMLTQKRTDPLSSFVAREKMIRRNPMKFVGDTATRLGGGDPDASVLDLVVDHETTPRTSDITADAPDTAKKGNAKLKGAITDIGGMLASALTPEQKTPLQFAPMQRQEFMPIIDPRFRRAKGGPIKKGQPYLVGEEGAEVIVPETATRLGGGDPDDLDRRFDELDLVVDHETTPRTPGLIVESPDTGKKGNGKLIKGAITDIGGMLASALSPEQKTPLQFAPMQRQEFMPIIDPRFRRAKGGPIKKGQPYLVGEEGAEVIVPEHDGMVIPNEQIAVDEDLGTQVPLDAPDEKIAINETPTTATVTEQVKQPTIADKLGAQINAYQDPDRYKKGSEFYDKKRNWKDALRSAGYGLLQSLASAPPTNDVGALLGRAIGGAGTGAVLGATMDNVDEKMRDQFKLAQLIPQYQNQMAMQKSQQEQALLEARRINELAKPTDRDLDRLQKERNAQAVTERAKMNIEFRQGIAKPYIDENGKVWKQYLNDPKRQLEPLVNPITGEQEFVPGEQGITWTDPNTKQSYTIKAKQSLMPSVGIATGNANRQTDADKFNTQKYWETEKENINNQMKWMSDIKALTTAAITADSGVTDDPGIRAQMDAKLAEITNLSNTPLPEDADPSKAQEQRITRVNKLVDDYNELNGKLLDTMSKSQAGKAKADQIRAQLASLPRPEKLKWKAYTPTMVQGGVVGKPVPPSKDPMGLFR